MNDPRLRPLIAAACRIFGCSAESVRRDRHKNAAAARHAIALVVRERWAGFSLPEIGRLLGGEEPFDHTTILSACKRMWREIQNETPFGRLALELLASPAAEPPQAVVAAPMPGIRKVPGVGVELDEEHFSLAGSA